jgi:inhibitor of KinA sporulation pathway (predicted exonuclease)
MAKKLDKALVIDVESTCWESMPPRGQYSEIIEVGLCVVDLQLLDRVERRCIMVKPMSSEVSEFCTNLTGITPDMVANAEPLSVAVNILLREYRSFDRLFVSWGDYDRKQFQRNCARYDLKYPFGPTHLNVKNMFAVSLGLRSEPGIDDACNRLGMTMEGAHHRGVDDAWNIANLFCMLLKRTRRAGWE